MKSLCLAIGVSQLWTSVHQAARDSSKAWCTWTVRAAMPWMLPGDPGSPAPPASVGNQPFNHGSELELQIRESQNGA